VGEENKQRAERKVDRVQRRYGVTARSSHLMDARRDHRHPGRPDHDGVARAGCRGRSCGTGHAGGGVRVGPQAAEPQHRTLTGARTGVNMAGTAGPDRCAAGMGWP
jgi:hypothetical protein